MKKIIREQLEELKSEYGFIPSTSHFKRALHGKILETYPSLKECIIDLFGEDEYSQRKNKLNINKGTRAKEDFVRRNIDHNFVVEYWTRMFKEIDYIPSTIECRIDPLNLFYSSLINSDFKTKNNYIEAFGLKELLLKSYEYQQKVSKEDREKILNEKIKPYIEELKAITYEWVSTFKSLGSVPPEDYISKSNKDEFKELYLAITSIYHSYNKFIEDNKLIKEQEKSEQFESLFRKYTREA
ncbi:hypothetical protein [Brassicibacter mesophilus]|uniref:hypothetical protein n=1 Tax=Brassicibacter mesophilus TaxID=745119 RepID=UPI003D22AB4E